MRKKSYRHSSKTSLLTPSDLKDSKMILDGIDRDVAFYRRRAGQVFFFGLLLEVLILAGREKEGLLIPSIGCWTIPFVYSTLFIAVAAVGIALGSEYRRRIRILKDSRMELLEEIGYKHVYPSNVTQNVSEIQVLYVVLVFLSSCGNILVWVNAYTTSKDISILFWILLVVFEIVGVVGLAYSVYKVIRWLIQLRNERT